MRDGHETFCPRCWSGCASAISCRLGYVVMPGHPHILIPEPQIGNPSTVVQAVKLGFLRRVMSGQQNPHVSQKRETWGTRLLTRVEI